ncbi:MAG: hypothetical protein GKR99_15455 [Rhodobacteraceae bacterium]|nr:hypothetical protein [Paracoccaceae bacterium]
MNPFANRAIPLSGPASDIIAVTPSDVTNLDDVAVALYIETGGALSLETVGGGSRTVNVADNAVLPVGVARVNATGTTASGIHALVIG